MKILNRSQVVIYATEDFLAWLIGIKPELHRWSLSNINHRPISYLIDVEDQNCHGQILQSEYKNIVENQLLNLYVAKEHWPREVTYGQFCKWFTYSYHEEIYDLAKKELESNEE